MPIVLVPCNQGLLCPSHGVYCDTCDYIICCTNDNGLCRACYECNGGKCLLGYITAPPLPSEAP